MAAVKTTSDGLHQHIIPEYHRHAVAIQNACRKFNSVNNFHYYFIIKKKNLKRKRSLWKRLFHVFLCKSPQPFKQHRALSKGIALVIILNIFDCMITLYLFSGQRGECFSFKSITEDHLDLPPFHSGCLAIILMGAGGSYVVISGDEIIILAKTATDHSRGASAHLIFLSWNLRCDTTLIGKQR